MSIESTSGSEKNDVRSYFTLEKLECEDSQNENCLEYRLNHFKKKDDFLYEQLLSMCNKVYSEALCMSMISFSDMKRELLGFYKNLKKKFKRKVIDPLFLMESRTPHLSCHTNAEGQKVLSLDLVVSPKDVVRFAGGALYGFILCGVCLVDNKSEIQGESSQFGRRQAYCSLSKRYHFSRGFRY